MPPRMCYDMTEVTNIAEGRLCHLGEYRSAFALNKEVFLRGMLAEPIQAKWKRGDNISSRYEYDNATMTSEYY